VLPVLVVDAAGPVGVVVTDAGALLDRFVDAKDGPELGKLDRLVEGAGLDPDRLAVEALGPDGCELDSLGATACPPTPAGTNKASTQ
jgi:hypothetical protein